MLTQQAKGGKLVFRYGVGYGRRGEGPFKGRFVGKLRSNLGSEAVVGRAKYMYYTGRARITKTLMI